MNIFKYTEHHLEEPNEEHQLTQQVFVLSYICLISFCVYFSEPFKSQLLI